MSELLLYIIATAVVLAGVAYFFVKQREQELAAIPKDNNRVRGKPKAKKEPKEPKEPKEKSKPKKPKVLKEREAPAPLTKKQLKNQAKEEDETGSVLEFLKGRKISTDATSEKAQAKVRTAASVEKRAEPVKARAPPKAIESESESDDEDDKTDYVTIKRKQIKPSKDNEDQAPESATEEGAKDQKPQKSQRKKFFTVQEKEQYIAEKQKAQEDYLARVAEREERKNRPPGERRKRREEGEEGADGFKAAQRERKPRRERTEGEGEEGEEGRSKYPPREPDVAPPLPTGYETAEIDSILNNLTSYYAANPEANLSKPKKNKSKAPVEEEEPKE